MPVFASDRIVVTATRDEAPLRDQAGNTAVIGEDAVDSVAPTHPSELLTRAPGAWITRGSSQEHLTAIRSPVLTGPGACGAFLYLEDGLPVRPAGFCNANQLIELNIEQAQAIEVVRGPGSALYGSNALHGLVNVITRAPRDLRFDAALDLGAHDYRRLRLDGDNGSLRGTLNLGHDGGWRDGSGYDQAKLNARWQEDVFALSFSATWLKQDVATFIIGQDAYRDRMTARSNPTPQAYRDMDAQRLSGDWRHAFGDWSLRVRPYARRSRMDFLQHFIPGTPVEENGHWSAGTQVLAERRDEATRWLVGADLEYADLFVRQTQTEPLTTGSPFLNETRPQGRHYDFEVAATTLAAFVHSEHTLGEGWRASFGVRVERTRYDYENRMDAGNLRDDGTACGMGGCLYNRPADRVDAFMTVSPKLGLVHRLRHDTDVYTSITRGHRAPQVNELYRLQRGQDVADLDSERMDALELGLRSFVGGVELDAVLFAMRKRDVVFQDSAGFAVSDGRTRHRGLELTLIWPFAHSFEAALSGTLARHTYDFDRAIAGGETIVRGTEVDTAPRRLANARIAWSPYLGHHVELEGVRIGSHWVDAGNQNRHPGHTVLSLRGSHALGDAWRAGWRVTNLTDRRYAERADFAFGDYRYFPGPPRTFFLTLATTL